MKKSAFTLIELLVVIVIIGILATISVAQYNNYQRKARVAKAQAETSQEFKAFMLACTESQEAFCGDLTPNLVPDAGLTSESLWSLPETYGPEHWDFDENGVSNTTNTSTNFDFLQVKKLDDSGIVIFPLGAQYIAFKNLSFVGPHTDWGVVVDGIVSSYAGFGAREEIYVVGDYTVLEVTQTTARPLMVYSRPGMDISFEALLAMPAR